MRSSQLNLDKYDSDKIGNRYLDRYDPILAPWVDQKITLLELGVYRGGSLLLWRDYFPLATIIGIDIALPREFKPGARIRLFEGSQADPQFLSRVADEVAPEGFDIIIDDASHLGELTKTAFWHLFDNHLKPNGLYVIEDWGTGYWDEWGDGKSFDLEKYRRPSVSHNRFWSRIANRLRIKMPMRSHDYGMVGFLKQLIDEQGAADATKKRWADRPRRTSKFDSMIITPTIVFVKKAGNQSVVK
jgi:hypothetical protein